MHRLGKLAVIGLLVAIGLAIWSARVDEAPLARDAAAAPAAAAIAAGPDAGPSCGGVAR